MRRPWNRRPRSRSVFCPSSAEFRPFATSCSDWFTRARAELDPSRPNEVTLRSLDLLYGYEPAKYLPDITPTPLLMIVASEDGLTGGNLEASAFQTAAEPKKIVFLPGGHFDAYTGDGLTVAAHAACDWLPRHAALK